MALFSCKMEREKHPFSFCLLGRGKNIEGIKGNIKGIEEGKDIKAMDSTKDRLELQVQLKKARLMSLLLQRFSWEEKPSMCFGNNSRVFDKSLVCTYTSSPVQ